MRNKIKYSAAGTRTFAYNAKGFKVSETLGEFSIDYGYDNKGRNDGFILNQGQNLLIPNSMSYDATGRLSSAAQNGASVNYNYMANSYMQSGQSLHNGAFVKVIGYEDKRNLPTSIGYKKGDSTLAARSYTFDNLGRITNRTQERVGESTRADIFGYNDRNELISATLGTDNFNYNFDNLGNRVSSTEKTETLNYTVNLLNQYSSISSSVSSVISPTFDDDGNQTTVYTETGVWLVEYNAENRPITFVQDSLKITCKYDYQGRRISKKVYQLDEANNYQLKTNNYFLYNGYLQIANFDIDNGVKNLEVNTFWDPAEPQATRPVALIQSANAQSPTPEIYYYSHDYTKNVCELFSIDEQNNVNIVRIYDYTPFGAVTEHIVDSSIENLNNNFKFSSEFYDLELALIYYNYRHYNPLDGRWINRDPIEERGGLNLYGMLNNYSVGKWDLLGLASMGGNPMLGGGSYLIYDDGSTSLDIPDTTDDGTLSKTFNLAVKNTKAFHKWSPFEEVAGIRLYKKSKKKGCCSIKSYRVLRRFKIKGEKYTLGTLTVTYERSLAGQIIDWSGRAASAVDIASNGLNGLGVPGAGADWLSDKATDVWDLANLIASFSSDSTTGNLKQSWSNLKKVEANRSITSFGLKKGAFAENVVEDVDCSVADQVMAAWRVGYKEFLRDSATKKIKKL